MYGQVALDLVRDAKRNKFLSNYNDEAIRQVVQEIKLLFTECNNVLKNPVYRSMPNKSDPFYKSNLVIHHNSILRNKRCTLAVLNHRLKKIRALRWELGVVLPAETKDKLSKHELDYSKRYDEVLGDYMASVDLDLTSDLVPPKDFNIEIRVLKDCGHIVTDSGSVNLTANTTHFLRRTDIEHLIRQGLVEHIPRHSG